MTDFRTAFQDLFKEPIPQEWLMTFGVIGVLSLAWGLLHMWLGAELRRYRPSARLLALGFAIINLVLFPFGTGLGAYALWVLLNDEGRSLFVEG